MEFRLRALTTISVILLTFFITVRIAEEVSTAENDAEPEELFSDPAELEQCRAINKGKWCTCRKLIKFVETKIGKVLGLFIPACGRWKPKLFKLKQCSGLRCWCVHPKTGRMKNGTQRVDHDAEKLECKLE